MGTPCLSRPRPPTPPKNPPSTLHSHDVCDHGPYGCAKLKLSLNDNAWSRPIRPGSVLFLNFMAEVPPLGVSTYFVRVVDSTSVPEAPRQHQAHSYDHSTAN